MRHLGAVRVFVAFVCLGLVGCGGGSEGNQNENSDNTNSNTNSNSNSNFNESALTAEQSAAVDDLLSALESTASTATASSLTSSAQEPGDTGGRTHHQLNTCTEVDVAFDTTALAFTYLLDFGTGCTPVLYPDVTFSGSLSGTIDFDDRSLEMVVNNLSAGENVVTGNLSFSFANEDGLITFTLSTLTIQVDGGGSIDVSGSWSVSAETGLVTFSSLTGAAIDMEGTTYQISATDLVVDPQGNGNFIPESGTVTITFPTEEGLFGDGSTTVEITFSETTPQDGVVLVSVDGSPQFEYQTALVVEE